MVRWKGTGAIHQRRRLWECPCNAIAGLKRGDNEFLGHIQQIDTHGVFTCAGGNTRDQRQIRELTSPSVMVTVTSRFVMMSLTGRDA